MLALAPPAVLWARRAGAGLAGGAAAALAMGIPTDVVANPWFTRMTPVRPLDVVTLVVTSVLLGLLAASYAGGRAGGAGRAVGGGGLTVLAIGCPVCNKLVVALIGFSGATTWFAAAQPVLGLAGAALAAWALVLRVRPRRACPRP